MIIFSYYAASLLFWFFSFVATFFRNVRVDLRYNEITEVDMDFAEVILEPTENRHVAVMLDGNPIHCDCHALAFKKFQMPSYLLQYTDLRCHTPPHLHGMKFREGKKKYT